ncbi:hypothetical protein LSAT2_009468, partial [Lamellibrachia satsuma]
ISVGLRLIREEYDDEDRTKAVTAGVAKKPLQRQLKANDLRLHLEKKRATEETRSMCATLSGH